MSGPHGPYQPSGQSFEWNRPPVPQKRWTKPRLFAVGAVGVLIFAIIGSCIDSPSDNKTPGAATVSDTSTTSPPPPGAADGYTFDELDTKQILVGTVESISFSEVSVGFEVDEDDTAKTSMDFELALIGAAKCYAMSEPLGKAVVEALPVGSHVTVVRTAEKASSTELGDEAFIHLAAPGNMATDTAFGPSVNEQLVAQGSASLMPGFDRAPDAPALSVQIETVRASVPVQSEPYVDPIAAADIKAWDERVGLAGVCRASWEKIAREAEESQRRIYGPDGIPDTDDDPNNNYNVPGYVPGTGGGSGGGGGGFCRSRFC
ncbi:hypothetical protein [Williamsia sp. DF01-3]|uniref:hypothetical protein n=1 Tax=Williamsia sp. DF01-3 TaxID=2934157 RepID=UPI001FF1C507|nr:hypothetical protein [Williamsia sp. DF01-3]MCK0517648.1 hypothetical protein [Williamsia sp. DF01-3]